MLTSAVAMSAMLLSMPLHNRESLMRSVRLQFEDECYPVWNGVQCLNEIISNLRKLGASSYHLITDRTVSQCMRAYCASNFRLKLLAWSSGISRD